MHCCKYNIYKDTYNLHFENIPDFFFNEDMIDDYLDDTMFRYTTFYTSNIICDHDLEILETIYIHYMDKVCDKFMNKKQLKNMDPYDDYNNLIKLNEIEIEKQIFLENIDDPEYYKDYKEDKVIKIYKSEYKYTKKEFGKMRKYKKELKRKIMYELSKNNLNVDKIKNDILEKGVFVEILIRYVDRVMNDLRSNIDVSETKETNLILNKNAKITYEKVFQLSNKQTIKERKSKYLTNKRKQIKETTFKIILKKMLDNFLDEFIFETQ